MLLILQLLLDSGQQLVSGQSTGVINNGDGAVSVQGNNRRSGHGRSGRSHAGGSNSDFFKYLRYLADDCSNGGI